MVTESDEMNSNQIARLKEAVWAAAQAMTNVCNCLSEIEGETRYFESLQHQTRTTTSTTKVVKEGNNV